MWSSSVQGAQLQGTFPLPGLWKWNPRFCQKGGDDKAFQVAQETGRKFTAWIYEVFIYECVHNF